MLSLPQMAALVNNALNQCPELKEKEVPSLVHNTEANGLGKKALTRRPKGKKTEKLVVMKNGNNLVTAIKRQEQDIPRRKRDLEAIGFKPINNLTEAPNAIQLWDSLLLTLRKRGLVFCQMVEYTVLKKKIRCYVFSKLLELYDDVFEELTQVQGEWIREVLGTNTLPMEGSEQDRLT